MKLAPVFLVAGIVIVGLITSGFLTATKDSHIELRGDLKKVRVGAAEASATIAVLDFRAENPSKHQFIVRNVDLIAELADGKKVNGAMVAEADVKTIFLAIPLLGERYNETLKTREKVAPKTTIDRMVAARFEVAQADFDRRKSLTIRVEEVDGAVSELREKR